jgi:hypothetical protein
MRIDDTDAVITFNSSEQKEAFAAWMQVDGFTAFVKSKQNSELEDECEYIADETDDFTHFEIG